MNQHTVFKIGDLVIIILVILLAAGILLIGMFRNGTQQKQCVISQNNQVISIIPLQEDANQFIEIGGDYHNVIEVKGTQVRFLSSTCTNQVCVATGWIEYAHQSAACLPNYVLVEVVGGESVHVDAIS